VALAKTQDEIQQEYAAPQWSHRCKRSAAEETSAAWIPVLQSARRREELQAKMVDLLATLAGQESQPGVPTFQ